ncbi:hypothetical protein Pint_14600 [Pistacia integerrima]|uniref:Uncharacterized protein n=1 Tax=Pistacia integerrima TaxID=434235 RepID=A0ACC0Y9Y7_9ROSI|nr:hypothetical protein Pint_14600 [Pistacia integerrima]
MLISLLQLHLLAGQDAVRAGYWFPGSEFPVSDIDSTLFTHLFCAFADLDPETNQVVVASSNQAQFSTFTQTVQQKNPSVKTLLSIGGGSNTIFHGLDLDWEYPSSATEMTNLGLLLNEWRAAIDNESTSTGNSSLLLAAAFFRSSDYYTIDYPIQAIANSLDWINVMAYDFYGPLWSNLTGPPAALYNPGNDQVSGSYGVSTWIQAGVTANKIVLGLPFYGYAWQLADANNHGFFAPSVGAALSSDGSAGYGQIEDFISENNATTVYNSTVVSNYCYSGTTWIGFDDTQSISAKVSYAKENGLLGYFAWHVAADDDWVLSQTASDTWGA